MQFWDPAQKVEVFVMPHLSVRRFPSCAQGDVALGTSGCESPKGSVALVPALSHTAWDTRGDTLLLLPHPNHPPRSCDLAYFLLAPLL